MHGVGSILAGKYRIERMIGEGGMGVVVAATHMHLGTQVALKFLHHDMAMNQQMAERFLREARASALLKSEHICRVSDVGMLDNGAPYIVMELLAGQDLSSMLRYHGPMPISTAADYVLQALVGLAEAHAAGIVHRDLKPGNLFWTQKPDGSALIKVLDFGIAKAPTTQNFSMTQTSTVMGSPGYMSPEQLKSSKGVDARSDIWSIGVILYELVAGRTPFEGETITELTLKVAMDPTPMLPGNFPPAFQAVISRCLEKDPTRRYQDVADVAQALAPFAGPRGQDTANGVTRVLRGHHAVPATQHALQAPNVPSHIQTSPPPTTPTTLGGASGVMMTQGGRNKGALIGGIVGLSVVGVVIGVVLASRGGDDKPTPAAGPTEPKPDPKPEPDPKPDPDPKTAVTPPPPPTPIDAGMAAPPPADAAVATQPPPPVDAGVAVAKDPPKDPKQPKKRPPKKKPEDVGDSRE